jgi:hypothetical protein
LAELLLLLLLLLAAGAWAVHGIWWFLAAGPY